MNNFLRYVFSFRAGTEAAAPDQKAKQQLQRPAKGVRNSGAQPGALKMRPWLVLVFCLRLLFVYATSILRACLITSFTRCAAFVGFVTGHPERRLFLWRSFGFAEHVFRYNSLAN